MNNRELENKIASSYHGIAPDILDTVLAKCDTQKGQIIPMQKKKKKTSLIKYFGAAAAALVLAIGGFGLGLYQSNRAVASTVMLDVNPGIGISVNKNEKVLDVKAYNQDAEKVIGNMDFSGSNLDVAVNALIGSMLRNGYISKEANSILVSVDSKDPAVGQEIQTRLMTEINRIMKSENVAGAVLGQTVQDNAKLQKLAEQYGITIGKAELIDQITKQNTFYTFADMVPLTINELNLISESGGMKLENVKSIGTASSSAYIGEQRAKEIAFQYAKVNEKDAVLLKCKLDCEKGIMVYEVDFYAGGYEYEVEINATTGEVVKYDPEIDDDHFYAPVPQEKTSEQKTQDQTSQQTSSGSQYVDEAAAKAAAFQHAGVKESDAAYCVCKPDHSHGVRIYEVDFVVDGIEYEYDINAETGEVMKYSKEKDDDYPAAQKSTEKKSEESSSKNGKKGDIGEKAAKAAALKHAGVSDIRDYECEVEYRGGKTVYEISFDSGKYEYEYEIDAADGTILKHEKERD